MASTFPWSGSISGFQVLSSTPNNTTTEGADDKAKAKQLLVAGVILAIAGAITIGVIVLFVLRMKTRSRLIQPETGTRKDDTSKHRRYGSKGLRALTMDHPASQITPFGSPGGETPRFRASSHLCFLGMRSHFWTDHTPGENMRIATRRSDGVWTFGDHRAPFNPHGVSDLENTPSPSVSSITPPWVRLRDGDAQSIKSNSTATSNWKSREKEKERLAGKGYGEYDTDTLPPPAYAYGRQWDDGGVLSPINTMSPIGSINPSPVGDEEGGYLQQSRFSFA